MFMLSLANNVRRMLKMNPEKINIGDNIQKYRKLKNYKQSDLAAKANVPTNNISRYENNKVVPSIHVLMKIATALNVTLSELTGEIEILETELKLKNAIMLSNYYKEKRDNWANILVGIRDEINSISDSEKIKKLFSEYEENTSVFSYYYEQHRLIERRIVDLCKDLNISKSDYKNTSILDEQSIKYLDCLDSINDIMNVMMDGNHHNKNKMFEQIINGDLECYKKLFSLDDLSFFNTIGHIVLSLYVNLTEGENEELSLDMFYDYMTTALTNKKLNFDFKPNQM